MKNKKKSNSKKNTVQKSKARITQNLNERAAVGGFTSIEGRADTFQACINTDVHNCTGLDIRDPRTGDVILLNGSQARAMFRLLNKHYSNAGRTQESYNSYTNYDVRYGY